MSSWRPIGVARKQKRSQTSMVGAMKMPGISLSASKRVLDPDRQVSWLRIVATGLLPKAAASVDLVHGSPVTVTGSRRIRTGFPFQLFRATCRRLYLSRRWPASPPPKGDRIIGGPQAWRARVNRSSCRVRRRKRPSGQRADGKGRQASQATQATRDCSK
jgi:hypothetical protein